MQDADNTAVVFRDNAPDNSLKILVLVVPQRPLSSPSLVLVVEPVIDIFRFHAPRGNFPVHRPLFAMVLRREDTIKQTMAAKGEFISKRAFRENFGIFELESGTGYPSTLLGIPSHDTMSDFLRVVVISCNGFKVTKQANGEGRVVMTLPMVSVFEHGSRDPQVVWQDLQNLWDSEHVGEVDHCTLRDFDKKFTMTKQACMRFGYSSDTTVVAQLAKKHPTSRIAQELSFGACGVGEEERMWLPMNQHVRRLVDTPPAALGPKPAAPLMPPPAPAGWLMPPPAILALPMPPSPEVMRQFQRALLAQQQLLAEQKARLALLAQPELVLARPQARLASPNKRPKVLRQTGMPWASEEDGMDCKELPSLQGDVDALSDSDFVFFD
jgi:hypothetical protein